MIFLILLRGESSGPYKIPLSSYTHLVVHFYCCSVKKNVNVLNPESKMVATKQTPKSGNYVINTQALILMMKFSEETYWSSICHFLSKR